MAIRLGRVEYLNVLPIYAAFEEGAVNLDAEFVKGPPALLNSSFLRNELDITPMSSIEYGRNYRDLIILPELSISADGRVESILLFSKEPVEQLGGKRICLTSSSATSVGLLKILMQEYYKLNVTYHVADPVLPKMLAEADAALLIGDDAMLAHHYQSSGLYVYDLGEVWKELTGMPMIYALWVMRKSFADRFPVEVDTISQGFVKAKKWGQDNLWKVIVKGEQERGFSKDILIDYFATIRHDFDQYYQQGLLTYFTYACRCGLLPEMPTLQIWGE